MRAFIRLCSIFCCVLAALLLIPSLSGSADPKVIEGAKREGEVVWYTATNLEVSKRLADDFQKKYPFVKPVLFRSNNSPLVSRVLSEARVGRHLWDVVGGGGELFTPIMEKGLFTRYRSPETKMMDSDLYDRNSFWAAYTVSTYVLGFNTRAVKKETVPKTYEALLDPKWKGRKIAVDTSAGMLHALTTVWGKGKAVSYFKQLAAQEPAVVDGNSLRAQLLNAGEFPLAFTLAHGTQIFATKGAPVDWIPLEPAPMRIVILALAARAAHPNAAKLFIDFVLSKEGQEIMRAFNRPPVRNDVDPNPPRLIRGY
ncbi:MAG: extracellular solute-binding protein, partial [Deltaproteobacteria bacterium]|nr:extracellular solute-binding protein [Deltaproteobacteria bacterium]